MGDRPLSEAEIRRLERLERTRANKRGRKNPAAVPARLARTSAFAPKRRNLITDSKFRRAYIVPGHSYIESFARRGDVRWLTPSGVADGTFEPIIGAPTGLNASS